MKFTRIIAIFLLMLCFGVVGIFMLDPIISYFSFKSLSASKVEREAQLYFEDNNESLYACVYTVECINDRAHLKLVSNFGDVDWDELKSVIWGRKFDENCTGRTVNIGMVLPTHSETLELRDTSRWEFGVDRFLTNDGRWQGGAFTDQPYEICTLGKAMFKR